MILLYEKRITKHKIIWKKKKVGAGGRSWMVGPARLGGKTLGQDKSRSQQTKTLTQPPFPLLPPPARSSTKDTLLISIPIEEDETGKANGLYRHFKTSPPEFPSFSFAKRFFSPSSSFIFSPLTSFLSFSFFPFS